MLDFKANKTDLLLSMRARAMCDSCRRDLLDGERLISPRQFAALDRLFALAGRILTEGIEADGRPRIFVGSSIEGLPVAHALRELLSAHFTVVVWDQGTVFGLGETTLEALEAAVLEYHNGVFVFTPDDQVQTRGQTRAVARDNVLFELGMFVGRLGRRSAFVLQPGGGAVSLPSDLKGLTTACYDQGDPDLSTALGPAVTSIRDAVALSWRTGSREGRGRVLLPTHERRS